MQANFVRILIAGPVAAMLLIFSISDVSADVLRIGRAATNFGYIPFEVGMAAGIYKQNGLDIELTDFGGAAKVQQAIAAGAADIDLGAGTDIGFIAKGAPELAIASITSSPSFLAIVVGVDTDIRTIDDLKGKRLAVTTAGSLTFWLAEELNRVHAWKESDAVTGIPLGGNGPMIAALKTHQVDGVISSSGVAYSLDEQGQARFLTPASAYTSDFEFLTVLASTSVLEKAPDSVRRFLKSWYETVAYMKQHRDETVSIASKTTGYSKHVEEREYDLLMPHFSTDGKFNPEALQRLQTIFADLKITDAKTDIVKLVTERYLDNK
jgi:ABC-type nitrate/sulfonate/bicarbonate transport system substrate-binding protein